MKLAVGTIFLGVLFLFAPATGEDEVVVKAINCYACSSDNSTECHTILKGQSMHLEECAAGTCYVIEENHPTLMGKVVRRRGCTDEEKCTGDMKFPLCCECKTDGCNDNNLCSTGFDTFSMGFSCLKYVSIVILMVL